MSFFRKERAPSNEPESSVVDLTEADFDDIVGRNELAIVMFCRPECPHCMRMEPLYRELSAEMVDRVLFCRVNIMTDVGLRRRYGITGTPTFVLMRRGAVVNSMVGERAKDLLKDELVKQF